MRISLRTPTAVASVVVRTDQSRAIEPESIDKTLGPWTIPVVDWTIPAFQVRGESAGLYHEVCCPDLEGTPTLGCQLIASAQLEGSVGGSLSLALPAKVVKAIERVVCKALSKLTGGSATCELTADIEMNNPRGVVALIGARDDCTSTVGWTGAGTVSAEVRGVVRVEVKIGGFLIHGELLLRDAILANLRAAGDRLVGTVGNSGPTISGVLKFKFLGFDYDPAVNHHFTSFAGSTAISDIPLPEVPRCGS